MKSAETNVTSHNTNKSMMPKFDFRINIIHNKIPTSLNDVAKDLFKMAVCFKPRLIRGGLRVFKGGNQTEDMMAEMEEILERGKCAYLFCKACNI